MIVAVEVDAAAARDRLYAVASTSANDARAAFFDDLVRCETRLYNAVGDRLSSEHGISTAQYELLRHLARHPRARVADLAAAFAAGVGAVSKMVDRLEGRDLVRRVPNPDDRRSSLIDLTAGGTALVADAGRSFDARLRELLAVLDADEVDAVVGVLGTLRRSLEDGRVGIPVG
jgi:DNA-binding MarR family transcriptional regulator